MRKKISKKYRRRFRGRRKVGFRKLRFRRGYGKSFKKRVRNIIMNLAETKTFIGADSAATNVTVS